VSRQQKSGRVLSLLVVLAVVGEVVFSQMTVEDVQESAAARVQRGLALLQAGERDRAEALFREVVQGNPRHGTANFQLGRLALERGDLEAARQHLETAVTSNPRRPFLAWFLLGRVQLAQREAASALESFERSLEAAPRFAPALVGQARAALFLGRAEEALRDLDQASALPGAPPETSLLAAELLVYLGRGVEARGLLATRDSPAADSPREIDAAREMLLAALSPVREDDRQLRILLGRNMSLAEGYLALAIRRILEDKWEEAVPLLRIALEMDDLNSIPLLFLQRGPGEEPVPPPPAPGLAARIATAYRLYDENRFEETARVAAGILERRPHFVPARLLMIRDAERREDFWTALAGYRRLLAWLPGLPALESQVADLAYAMGAADLAECSARRALEDFPESGALYYRLGTILADRDDTEGALRAFERAIELDFEEARAWLALGKLRLDRMEIAEAISAYGKALELDPDAAEVIGSLALSSLTTQEFTGVRGLLERHAAAHPDNVDTLYSLGVMSLRDGREDQAEEYFRKVARKFPDHPQVHYNLGQIYLRQGRREESRAEMDRFRELKALEDENWLRHNRSHGLRLEAEEALSAGDPGKAVEAYLQIIADGTAELEDYVSLGGACLAVGRPSEALGWFEKALEEAPYERDALEGLVRAATAVGEDERARRAEARVELLTSHCTDRASG
jgi:tetratricopeptide (TPR) repeat protein